MGKGVAWHVALMFKNVLLDSHAYSNCCCSEEHKQIAGGIVLPLAILKIIWAHNIFLCQKAMKCETDPMKADRLGHHHLYIFTKHSTCRNHPNSMVQDHKSSCESHLLIFGPIYHPRGQPQRKT